MDTPLRSVKGIGPFWHPPLGDFVPGPLGPWLDRTVKDACDDGPVPPIIRSALLADVASITVHDIFKLRGAVFVVEQDCPYPDLDGRDAEPGAEQFWTELDGQVVACLRRLREPDGAVRIGRIATRADHRGQGLAEALVAAALAGVTGPAVLDAQVQLEGWYARLGFERSGPEYVEDGIPHLPMRRGGGAERSRGADEPDAEGAPTKEGPV